MMNRLREIRESTGLTLAQVAEAVKCTPMTIQRFETGKRNISLRWLEKLAKFYKKSVAELVDNEKGMHARSITQKNVAKLIASLLVNNHLKDKKTSAEIISALLDVTEETVAGDLMSGELQSRENYLRLVAKMLDVSLKQQHSGQ